MFFTETISTEKLIVLLLMEKEMEEAILKYSLFLRVLKGQVTGGCLQLPLWGGGDRVLCMAALLLSSFCPGLGWRWAPGLRLRQTVSFRADTHIVY